MTDFSDSTMLKILRKIVFSVDESQTGKFFVKRNGKILATPLLIALCFIELSDVAFAVDSVPAVFGNYARLFYCIHIQYLGPF